MQHMHLYSQIKRLFDYAESGVTRIKTGISPIDEKIRGVAPGEVCMILGRSYSGKSMVAQNIVAHNKDIPSIFFSMEMPYVQALVRMHAMHYNENATQLMDSLELGSPPESMWELINEFPYHAVVDEPNLGFDELSRSLEVHEDTYGQRAEFVVVDYLELLAGAKRSGEGFVAVDKVATTLKDWAKAEEMRVFVLHQCNRNEPRWEPPTESSPRFGGYTESDFVIGLWRPSFDPNLQYAQRLALKDTVRFNIIKNRPFGLEAECIECVQTDSLRLLPQQEELVYD